MKLYNIDLFKLLPGVEFVGVPNAVVVMMQVIQMIQMLL